jgi:hypothetical protein
MFTADMWDSEKLTRMVRELQPGIIINNRASMPGDFDTPEQKIGMYQLRPWESCITLCQSWSWSPTPVKSKKAIIDLLTATACGNGNMLLSWGPKWDGSTYRGKTAFLYIIGETGNKLSLPTTENKIVNAIPLTGGDVRFSQTDEGVIIDLNDVKRNAESIIIEINFENEVLKMAQ